MDVDTVQRDWTAIRQKLDEEQLRALRLPQMGQMVRRLAVYMTVIERAGNPDALRRDVKSMGQLVKYLLRRAPERVNWSIPRAGELDAEFRRLVGEIRELRNCSAPVHLRDYIQQMIDVMLRRACNLARAAAGPEIVRTSLQLQVRNKASLNARYKKVRTLKITTVGKRIYRCKDDGHVSLYTVKGQYERDKDGNVRHDARGQPLAKRVAIKFTTIKLFQEKFQLTLERPLEEASLLYMIQNEQRDRWVRFPQWFRDLKLNGDYKQMIWQIVLRAERAQVPRGAKNERLRRARDMLGRMFGWNDAQTQEVMEVILLKLRCYPFAKWWSTVQPTARSVGRNLITVFDDYVDEKGYYMVMEYCDGKGGEDFTNLIIARRGPIGTEAQMRTFFRQLLNAVEHLHARGICHLDVSLEQVMLCGEQLRLLDPGMARYLLPNGQYFPATRDAPGKPNYKPPELCRMLPFCGRKVDVHCMGVCLFILLLGFPPRDHTSQEEIEEWLKDLGRSVDAKRLKESGALDLMARMMHPSIRDRISIPQIRAHRWTRGVAVSSRYSGAASGGAATSAAGESCLAGRSSGGAAAGSQMDVDEADEDSGTASGGAATSAGGKSGITGRSSGRAAAGSGGAAVPEAKGLWFDRTNRTWQNDCPQWLANYDPNYRRNILNQTYKEMQKFHQNFLSQKNKLVAVQSLGCFHRGVYNQLKVTSEQAASLLWFCYIEMLRRQGEDAWLPSLSAGPKGGSEDEKTGGG